MNLLKRLLQLVPFVRHRPPWNIALRKAILLSINRPVKIKRIEKEIISQYNNHGDTIIKDIENGIIYLRKERFFKTDAANLLVGSVRGIATVNRELALNLGFKFLPEIPDMRVIRTMVSFLDDKKDKNKIFKVLKYAKDKNYIRDIRNSVVYTPAMENSNEKLPPWTFELAEITKLGKKPIFFKHEFDPSESANSEGLTPEYEVVGQIKIAKSAPPTAALVRFEFYDENYNLLTPGHVSGLTHSKAVGWYSYLRQENDTGYFGISFELPQGCTFAHIGFQTWHAKTSVKLIPGFEARPSSINKFHIEFDQFVQDLERSKSDELVFMFSGTTYVQDVRANRPIRLTRELRKRNIPVIFNYHRWRRTDDHPPYQGDLLFQIPIDVTKQFMAKLSTLKTDKKKIFIVSYPHPTIPKILNRFKINGWINLYDARDDWEEFEKVGQAKWYKSSVERYIVRNCDHVTAVSKPLADKLDQYEPMNPVHVVPNALSPNFLSHNYRWNGGSNIKIGYFGHLTSSWFDWDSLIEISKRRPRYKFEIIGHSAPDNLELPPNIDLMGPKTHPEINIIAAEWNVAIIPFKTGLLSDAVDPIKIYEYMALDLPTVSFRMPQIDSYPATITVENVEDFLIALDEFSKYRPKKGSLSKWLSKNTWGDRIDYMLNLSHEENKDGLALLGGEVE